MATTVVIKNPILQLPPTGIEKEKNEEVATRYSSGQPIGWLALIRRPQVRPSKCLARNMMNQQKKAKKKFEK